MTPSHDAQATAQPPAAPPARLWIPPWALVAAQLAHGVSWLLLARLASQDLLAFSLPGLAWVHLVALGWLTMASLAVLIHVIPGFLDLQWRGERLARNLLLPYGIGVAGMVAAFWFGATGWLAVAASVVGLALGGYLLCALMTLLSGPGALRSIVRRGFILTLGLLTLTAVIGLGMAFALDGHASAWWLVSLPVLHAHLGALGWLSLLVIGVSARTVRPITGGGTTVPWLHPTATTLLTFGLLGLAMGLLLELSWLPMAGGALMAAGVLAYVTDMAGILRRARVPHRPPQAFLAAGSLYFLGTAGLGLGVILGRPEWQAAYAFLALMGWLGQMVNGHLHHIGVRVLATWVLGDDDSTPPSQLLTPRLSWATFWLFQTAVAGTVGGLLLGRAGVVEVAALAGFAAWLVMGLNMIGARRHALARRT